MFHKEQIVKNNLRSIYDKYNKQHADEKRFYND
jgi:hypothetical protein